MKAKKQIKSGLKARVKPAGGQRTDREPKAGSGPRSQTRKSEARASDLFGNWKWEGFASIPYPVIVLLLHALPEVALKVYVALLFFESYTKGTMYPGQDTLALLTGLSERSVWNGVEILREAGLITSQRQWNMSNLYARVEITPENWPAIHAKLEATRTGPPSPPSSRGAVTPGRAAGRAPPATPPPATALAGPCPAPAPPA